MSPAGLVPPGLDLNVHITFATVSASLVTGVHGVGTFVFN